MTCSVLLSPSPDGSRTDGNNLLCIRTSSWGAHGTSAQTYLRKCKTQGQETCQRRTRGHMQEHTRREVFRELWGKKQRRRNKGDTGKETLWGTLLETRCWKELLHARGRMCLRNCDPSAAHTGADTCAQGLLPAGNPCQSR